LPATQAAARRRRAFLVVILAGAGMAAPARTSALDAPAARSSTPVRVPIGTGFSLGSARAPVVMIEFADHQCPFCRRHLQLDFPELKTAYIDTGKLRYVVRDFPLDIHAEAFRAAEAARCAGAQGRFWPMREALGAHMSTLSAQTYPSLAAELGLAAAPFKACMADHRFEAAIKADIAVARAAGLDRTPSFVIGRAAAGTVVGTKVVGAQGFAAMKKQIDALLRAR
jgi:protein-disulfide isomerase